jgi:WD40-like Beta Propeller Repeat
VLHSGFFEGQARFSPDGRWIAYTTDKDGISEIYVVEAAKLLPPPGQSAPPAGPVSMGRRVSTAGGTQPQWRRDGKTVDLFYLAPNRRLMAASIQDGGPGVPLEILDAHVSDAGRDYQTYAVSRENCFPFFTCHILPRRTWSRRSVKGGRPGKGARFV